MKMHLFDGAAMNGCLSLSDCAKGIQRECGGYAADDSPINTGTSDSLTGLDES
jgi:hypothetical protein